MNANLKIVLALGAVLLAIFGATVISTYTGRDAETLKDTRGITPDGDAPGDTPEPIRYSMTQIYYNPKSDNPALHDFPGYFEVNDQEHSVTYWLQNVNVAPVEVAAVRRSCNACTSLRMAVFPARPRRPDVEAAHFAALGVAGAEAVEPADRARRLRDHPAAEWKLLDFDHPERRESIPPAAGTDSPTWVALQLNFKVRQKGSKILTATLGFKTPSQSVALNTDFHVAFWGSPRYDVSPVAIDFKEMAEKTPDKSEDIFYWSATVPQKDLTPPECSNTTAEHFLTYSRPEPLTESERALLVAKVSNAQAPMRVLSGYRVTVTLHRKNPDPKPGQPAELDIGTLEKAFVVLPSGSGDAGGDPPRVTVRATVTGLVTLFGGGTLDLGTFAPKEGTAKSFTLTSDRRDLELELLPESTVPKVLKAELEAPQTDGGRRLWTLKVRVAAGATAGEFPGDSAVVLRAKGTGQLVRLPVKGRALAQ